MAVDDMFIAHIGSMDCFARGLRNAARIREEGTLGQMLTARYSSWDGELGQKVESGNTTLEELEQYVLVEGKGLDPPMRSGQQEKYECIFSMQCNRWGSGGGGLQLIILPLMRAYI